MKFFSSKFISLIAILAFLTLALIPNATVFAQGDPLKGATVPVLKSPHGTILNTLPTYIWTKITGASVYQYQVWKGSFKVLDKSPDSGICSGTTCQKKPEVKLGYNEYKWRVRARVNGIWKAWSPYMTFVVSPPGFTANFSGTKPNWQWKAGAIWQVNSTYMFTNGTEAGASSVYYNLGQYSDFEYSAKVQRVGEGQSYLTMRMGTSLGFEDTWYPGYLFGYNNNGEYSIWWMNGSGAATPIQSMTFNSAIVQNGWNTLKIVVKGDTFKFYINNVLLKTFTHSGRTRGYIGFEMYKNSGASAPFQVDWAKLTVLETAQ